MSFSEHKTTIVTKNSHLWYLHWAHTRLALSTASHEGGRGLWGVIPLPAELLAQVDLGERGVTVINYVHTEDPTRLQ